MNNANMIRRQLSGMGKTLAEKEREYTLDPQLHRQIAGAHKQTFWGMTGEEWHAIKAIPLQIVEQMKM